jgi:hypothetical protein
VAANERRVQYPLYLRSVSLRKELERIANQERRSLNEIINIACEEFVAKRKP